MAGFVDEYYSDLTATVRTAIDKTHYTSGPTRSAQYKAGAEAMSLVCALLPPQTLVWGVGGLQGQTPSQLVLTLSGTDDQRANAQACVLALTLVLSTASGVETLAREVQYALDEGMPSSFDAIEQYFQLNDKPSRGAIRAWSDAMVGLAASPGDVTVTATGVNVDTWRIAILYVARIALFLLAVLRAWRDSDLAKENTRGAGRLWTHAATMRNCVYLSIGPYFTGGDLDEFKKRLGED